ncbi:two-component regulator propeller domain-containing protein [Polaribacter sp. Z022]|uniref:ligand-binding sensor domain-containing protein n=1 Tax=Polaribacter sp. Z022 TaxID=2927125 RepID=UPI002020F015|nr:two-component regulator propeller domain-containing protein [Polaribacter sp. Z022]MCL7753755.1 diguanylate cyclase [Polaribacter sp. Z022]
MNYKPILICLIFLTLSFSCVGNKSSEKTISKPEYVNIPKNTTLKFTSGISAMFQDSKGFYWFGSLQEGVAIFDGNSFRYFTVNEGLSDNQIRSIQEDKNGIIWINTAHGLSTYDGIRITNNIPIINNFSQNIWTKTDNDLWFNPGNKEGVYQYNGQNLKYLAFPQSKVINPNNVYFITDISKGKNNMIWFATYAGVFGYNGINFSIINDETLGLNINTEPLHIRSILEDSKGRLWIGNNGIGVLLKDADTIINFSEKNNLIHPTSSRKGDKSKPGTLEHVFAIEEDLKGNIWFGDRDAGIWKYDGKNMTNYTKKDGLTNNFAYSIFEDKKGDLWFGMVDGNIFKFNGNTFDKQF